VSTLSATVSGTAQGTMNYTFYCNRSDSGVDIASVSAASYSGASETTKTASCNYTSLGTYTGKVIVERGTLKAEARVTINVSSPPVAQCSLAASQETGANKKGISNTWTNYASFAPTFSGKIQKIQINAGNYGNISRAITCKVTDSSGATTLSPELKTEAFLSGTGTAWRTIDFGANTVDLQATTTYRLYCKGPDTWNSVYWAFDTTKGLTQRVYLCSGSSPSPTLSISFAANPASGAPPWRRT